MKKRIEYIVIFYKEVNGKKQKECSFQLQEESWNKFVKSNELKNDYIEKANYVLNQSKI